MSPAFSNLRSRSWTPFQSNMIFHRECIAEHHPDLKEGTGLGRAAKRKEEARSDILHRLAENVIIFSRLLGYLLWGPDIFSPNNPRYVDNQREKGRNGKPTS